MNRKMSETMGGWIKAKKLSACLLAACTTVTVAPLAVKPHFIPDDFCKLFQSKSPVIKCGNDNDSKLFQS